MGVLIYGVSVLKHLWIDRLVLLLEMPLWMGKDRYLSYILSLRRDALRLELKAAYATRQSPNQSTAKMFAISCAHAHNIKSFYLPTFEMLCSSFVHNTLLNTWSFGLAETIHRRLKEWHKYFLHVLYPSIIVAFLLGIKIYVACKV